MKSIKTTFLITLLFQSFSVMALDYILPPEDVDVFGEVFTVKVKNNESLLDIARRYSIGYNEMRQANPGIDMWVPGNGTEITIPARYIIPPVPREGVVINIAEMRLYYFPKVKKGKQGMVMTYPISVGRRDWDTPIGVTRIVSKKKNPSWTPPKSIREEHAADGDILPATVPAGPNNPLGNYAMRLGISGYLIHGTNRPSGVGMRVTHGCIRMFPEDIEYFFHQVRVGTKVTIVNLPYKAGWLAGTLFLEAHPLLEDDKKHIAFTNFTPIVDVVAEATKDRKERIDRVAISRVTKELKGIPEAISRD
ncbi:MAG: LysM peptidoglycan-binding domain-containing protein [Gammaproteobacteria bacterium]|nr:MAG: LysM peptidoglycan-binding domain-containing protein [Gammaproteobacteria bacterium]